MAQQFSTVQVLSCSKKTRRNYQIHPCWRITERAHCAKVVRSFPGSQPDEELVVTCRFGAQVGEVTVKYNGGKSVYRTTQHGKLQSLLQTCLLKAGEPLFQTYAQFQAHFRDAGWKEIYAGSSAVPGAAPGACRRKNPLPDISMITAQDAWI
jgi:hypothetical protein